MKSGSSFEVVTTRLLEALNLPNEKALALALGLQPTAWYNRKKKGSLPLLEIVEVSVTSQMCLDWVLLGRGRPFLDPEKSIAPAQEVDGKLLATVLMALRRSWRPRENVGVRDAAVLEIGRIGGIAGLIYNRVANLKSDVERARKIQEEAVTFGAVVAAMDAIPGKGTDKDA